MDDFIDFDRICPEKSPQQSNFQYFLQIGTILSAFITVILSIVAVASLASISHTLQDIYSSWDQMPIMDLSAVPQANFDNGEEACAALGKDWYSLDTFPSWAGTEVGCDCSSMNTSSSHSSDDEDNCQSSYSNKCRSACDSDCSDIPGKEEIDIEIFNGYYLCVKRSGNSALNRTADLYDLKDVKKCKSDETVCGPLADFFLNGSTSFPPGITPGPSENFCFPKNAPGCPLVHFETQLAPIPNCTTALANSTANGCNAVSGFGLFLTWTASAIDVLTPENYTFDWRAIPNVELSAGNTCFFKGQDKTGNKNTIQSTNGTQCPPIDHSTRYIKPEPICLSGKKHSGCEKFQNVEMTTDLALSSNFTAKFDTRFYPAGEFNLTQAWTENGVPENFAANSDSKLFFQARPELFWIDEKCPESRRDVYSKGNVSESIGGLQVTLMIVNIIVFIIFWCVFPSIAMKETMSEKPLMKGSSSSSGGDSPPEKHRIALILKYSSKLGKYIIGFVVVGIIAALTTFFLTVTEGKCSDDLTNVNFWQIWNALKVIGGVDEATATADGITGALDILELYIQRVAGASSDYVLQD